MRISLRRPAFILVCFAIILVSFQNCKVSMTEDQPQKLILSAEMTSYVAINQSVVVELQTSVGSAPIQSVSFEPTELVQQVETNARGTAVLNQQNFSVTYVPAWGYQGADKVTVYVTSTTGQNEAYPVTFLVGNDGSKPLPDINALVYGANDRTALTNKLKGYAPPSMSDIFKNWGRFGGGIYYPPGTAIPTSSEAASWVLLTGPERVSCTVNSGKYTGFVSSAEFESYSHDAVLTSPGGDDDLISIIIAFAEEGGHFYTLSASRTKGGFPQPLTGWGITYEKDGVTEWVLGEKNSGGKGAVAGWSNEKTRVLVVRTGDTISAKTSNWNVNESSLTIDNATELKVNLNSDPRLAKFKGAKRYGYGSYSQASTTFLNVKFSTGLDDRFVYDLVNNYVYEQGNDGKYTLRQDIDAYMHVGAPRKATNPDIGRTYMIRSDRTYELVK